MTKAWHCCQKRRASDKQDGNCSIRYPAALGWLLSTVQLGRLNFDTKAVWLWLDLFQDKLKSLAFNLPLEQLMNLPLPFVKTRLCHENNPENPAWLIWF